MLPVKPMAEVDCGRLKRFAMSLSGSAILVNTNGIAAVLAPGLVVRKRFQYRDLPAEISISRSGERIASIHYKRLRVADVASECFIATFDGEFEHAEFMTDAVLWASRKNEAVIDVFDIDRERLIATKEIDDPFGDSAIVFCAHPDRDHVAVWVAAGQDGQCINWARLNDDGAIAITPLHGIVETTPPVFDATGERFLIIVNDEIRHYAFGDDRLLGSLSWPFDDDDAFSHVAYAAANRAVFQSNNTSRLFAVDLDTMSVLDEVVLEGHEARPARDLYKLNDDELTTDVSYLVSHSGNAVVSMHLDLPCPDIRVANQRALLWQL